MTNDSIVQRLLAIKVQIDTLLGDVAERDDSPAQPTVTAPARVTLTTCKHPPTRRESLNGFGGGPNRYRCGACGATVIEG